LGLVEPVAMVFGADAGDANRALHGQVDELATFDRALSKTEIENLFVAAGGQLPEPPPNPGETATASYLQTAQNLGGLRNHWRMEETTGTTAADMIAGNDGTYTNVSGDPVALGQPGPGAAEGYVGFETDNKSTQFVWNTGANQCVAQDGTVLGEPGTGSSGTAMRRASCSPRPADASNVVSTMYGVSVTSCVPSWNANSSIKL